MDDRRFESPVPIVRDDETERVNRVLPFLELGACHLPEAEKTLCGQRVDLAARDDDRVVGLRAAKFIPGDRIGRVDVGPAVDDEGSSVRELEGAGVVVRMAAIAVLPDVSATNDRLRTRAAQYVEASEGKSSRARLRWRGEVPRTLPGIHAQSPRDLLVRRARERSFDAEDCGAEPQELVSRRESLETRGKDATRVCVADLRKSSVRMAEGLGRSEHAPQARVVAARERSAGPF